MRCGQLRVLWVLGFVCWQVGCQFDRPADVDPDARELDALVLECTPATTSCANDRFTECDASGRYTRYDVPNGGGAGAPNTVVMHDFACPLGCADTTRCADPVPSHDLAATIPTWVTGGVDVDLETSSGSFISLDTGFSGTEIELADAAGNTFRVPIEVVPQLDGPEILVLKVRTLTLRAPARLVATGPRALAVVAGFDIVIEGRLEANGTTAAGATATGACIAAAAPLATGGGGNWHGGGASSDIDPGGEPQPVGQPVLIGGCGGGAIVGSVGGSPGGAVQLVSRTRIALIDQGVLSVAGGGGRAFTSLADGVNRASGGGSGGQVVLEAPAVQIAATARVVGRGGSGAAARSGQVSILADGLAGDADLSSDIVAGATCADCGFGGRGGVPGMAPERGVQGTNGWAGGGGSVGRAIVATRTGAVPPPVGTMLIEFALGTLPRR